MNTNFGPNDFNLITIKTASYKCRKCKKIFKIPSDIYFCDPCADELDDSFIKIRELKTENEKLLTDLRIAKNIIKKLTE